MPMPEVPQPESLPTFEERMGPALDELPPEVRRWMTRDRPIETRNVDVGESVQAGAAPAARSSPGSARAARCRPSRCSFISASSPTRPT